MKHTYEINRIKKDVWEFLTEEDFPWTAHNDRFVYLVCKKSESYFKQKTDFYFKLGVKKECSLPQLKYVQTLIETLATKLFNCLASFKNVSSKNKKQLEEIVQKTFDFALGVWKDLHRIHIDRAMLFPKS